MGQSLSQEQLKQVTWKGEWTSNYYPLVSGEIYLCLPIDLSEMIGTSTNIIGYVKYNKLSIYKPGQIDTITFTIDIKEDAVKDKKLKIISSGLSKQEIIYFCNIDDEPKKVTRMWGKYVSSRPYDFGTFDTKKIDSVKL